ncbi:MAG: M28 family peptidase [Calditrichaeota bacterium]|nr:M28 family peptidase [Calditrichota bacterium]
MQIKLTLVFILLASTICSQSFNKAIETVISQTNLDSLVSYVRILSGEDSVYVDGMGYLILNRKYNKPGNEAAAIYIKNKLENFGLQVNEQPFNSAGVNIIGIQEGTTFPNKYFIVCAHYDAVANYCADDDASGVAAVLETARLLSNYKLNYSIHYILWDEEEQGLLGSDYYAQNAERNGVEIEGVLNLEMFGYDADNDGVIDVHSKNIANSDQMASTLANINSIYNLQLDPTIFSPGETSSDHSSFWRKGYGAICFGEAYWADDFNPYYHTSSDRINKFNLTYFHKLSKLTIGLVTELTGLIEDNSLPVTFVNFYSETKNNIIVLRWQTQTELNNAGFEIQRFDNLNKNFIKIAFVDGKGNSNSKQDYTYIDSETKPGRQYNYRLKQIDYDGSYTFSNIISISLSEYDITVLPNYPNPFNSFTTIPIILSENSKVALKIYDTAGRIAQNNFYFLNKGKQKIIVKADKLTSGIYYSCIMINNEIVDLNKMMVIK